MSLDDAARLLVPVAGQDHVQGSVNAAVTLVEYGDYQCATCGAVHQYIKALQQQLSDLCFVFRHLPQPSIHPYARRAAEAAEAAAVQGQFWQMHDTLFSHQQALGNDYLVEYAYQLGLDVRQFLQELSTQAHIARIDRDIAGGLQLEVTVAPALFVNGTRYTGGWNLEQLIAAIVTVSN